MKKPSRNHHFIPAFYLAGFTPSGSKEDFLWVIDTQIGKYWRSKSENTGFQKDLHSLVLPAEFSEVAPDLLEMEIEKLIESPAAKVIQNIINHQCLPDKEDFDVLIGFVGLQTVLTPSFRSVYEKPLENAVKMAIGMMTAIREKCNAIIEDLKRVRAYLRQSLPAI